MIIQIHKKEDILEFPRESSFYYENGSYRGLWYGNLVTDGRIPQCKVQSIDNALGESLDNTGRAILYGIYFEIDSATLKPESSETLQQVLKTIKTKPYTVLKGDSPYKIAQKYQMNLSEFLRINNLAPRSTIFPGQILLVKAE